MKHHNALKLQHFCCTSIVQISVYATANGRISPLQFYHKKVKRQSLPDCIQLTPSLFLFPVFSYFACFNSLTGGETLGGTKWHQNIYKGQKYWCSASMQAFAKHPKNTQQTLGKFSRLILHSVRCTADSLFSTYHKCLSPEEMLTGLM